MRGVLVGLVVAGCGRFGFDDVPRTVDASEIDAQPIDAPASCFRDDFADGVFDPRWTAFAPNGGAASVTEQAGVLVVTLMPNQAGYNGLIANGIDLSGDSAIEVVLAQVTSEAGFVETSFILDPDASNRYLFSTGAGSFVIRAVLAGGANDDTVVAWDPSLFRRERVRHDHAANMIVFETSVDGTTWTQRKTAGIVTSLAAVKLSLIAGAYGTGNDAPGEAHFDDLRVVTPSCP